MNNSAVITGFIDELQKIAAAQPTFSQQAAKWGKRLALLGVATYGVGRGLTAGRADADRSRERDAQIAAEANGRYTPF